MATNPAASSIDVIQQISDDANLLHRFCHGGDAESVRLGGRDTPTVHSFLSTWIEFLHSVTIAGESISPSLEQGFYDINTGGASTDATTTPQNHANWLRTASYYPVFEGRIYAVDFNGLTTTVGETPGRVDIHFYDESKTWLSAIGDNIFFKVPASARYVRLCFAFSSAATAGSSPSVVVKDVVAGTRSAAGGNGKRAIAVNWHYGYLGFAYTYDGTKVDVGYKGGDEQYRYALIFVSKGDLVWLKAGQAENQSVIACIDATGAISHKVVQGAPRDFWLDHMWIADQDTCVIISNQTQVRATGDCIIYPNFLYNNDTFNDAATNKEGYIVADSGSCSHEGEVWQEGSSSAYASSQLICLKKGQSISSVSGTYTSTIAIGIYDKYNAFDSSKSISGLSLNMNFYGYRCDNNDFCFVRLCGRVSEQEHGYDKTIRYKVSNPTALSGKKFAMLGDSYVDSDNRSSYAHAAFNLGMDFTPYGISGNTVSAYQTNGMVNRYTQMANGFDYVGLVGGRNDYNNSVPIGSLDSTDTSTFCGALNVLCEGLIKKYIGAKIFGVTSWNVNSSQNAYNDAFVAVVSGRWNIPVLQSYKGVNVYVKVEEFREAFCVADSDVSHLNFMGHMKIMAPTIEAFLKTL